MARALGSQPATPVVAIIGRPNVGKSSLFNRLVGSRQAITHETAGTTRDANYGTATWNSKHMMLVDTAGMTDGTKRSKDQLDAAVQTQVHAAADVADVLVLVIDASTMITHEDQQAAQLVLKSGKPAVLAINKIDAAAKELDLAPERLGIKPYVEVSAIHGRGTGDLLDAITAKIKRKTSAPKNDPVINLAIIGRPNVGKSSIINSLVGKQQALVSERAGTTRDVGSIDVRDHGSTIRLLDTAGLRRRGRIEQGIEQFAALRTASAIARADVCALIMDATEPSVAGDQHIAGQVLEAGKGLILVMNKWDLIEKETGTQERYTRKLVSDFAFAHWTPLVYTSAAHGLNVVRVLTLAREVAATRTKKIPTTELNRLIENLIAKHPPAGLKNRQPKIKYATQTGINPPTFTLFSSYPESIHFSYVRYLENGLRERYPFEGTPIKIEFRSKR